MAWHVTALTIPALARYLTQSVTELGHERSRSETFTTMRKITLTKKALEEGEEDVAPKKRRDSEVSFEDSSSGYSSLSEQFAGGHL